MWIYVKQWSRKNTMDSVYRYKEIYTNKGKIYKYVYTDMSTINK